MGCNGESNLEEKAAELIILYKDQMIGLVQTISYSVKNFLQTVS